MLKRDSRSNDINYTKGSIIYFDDYLEITTHPWRMLRVVVVVLSESSSSWL